MYIFQCELPQVIMLRLPPRLSGTSPSQHSIVLETVWLSDFSALILCYSNLLPIFKATPPEQLVFHCVEQRVVHLRQVPSLCLSSPQPWWQHVLLKKHTQARMESSLFVSIVSILGYVFWEQVWATSNGKITVVWIVLALLKSVAHLRSPVL